MAEKIKVRRKIPQKKKENVAEINAEKACAVGSTTGSLGISFAACHTICQAAIAFLAVFGIAVAGIPLAFLGKYGTPFLLLGLASFGFSIYLYKKHRLPLKSLLKPAAIGIGVAFIIIAGSFFFAQTESDDNAVPLSFGPLSSWQVKYNLLPEKCRPTEEYKTEESWKEHLGHHQDIFGECLA